MIKKMALSVIEHNMYKWRNLGQIAEIWTLKDHSDLERYKAESRKLRRRCTLLLPKG